MPNLAGILDLRTEPTDVGKALETVARVLRVPGLSYQECAWHDARFGAVNLLDGNCDNLEQPAVSVDGDRVLFLDGEVHNLESLRGRLPAVRRDGLSAGAATLCLALFETCGDAFAEMLNGQFNIVLYERRSPTVKIFNDRLAYRPLYYLQRGGLSLFAVEKKAIFALAEARFDPNGLVEFFAFGHNLEDRTVFRNVQVMPQGAVLRLDASGTGARQYWRPRYSDVGGPSGLDESAEELGRRLCRAAAVRAKRPRRYGIFLSGGLDSRAAAGALAGTRNDVIAFTFGREESREVRYAREMAQRLGFSHRRLSYEGVSYSDALPRIVWRTECAIPFNQTLSTEQHRYIHPEVQVMFNGHFGDALTGGHILPQQLLMRSVDRLVEHILAKRTLIRLAGLRLVFREELLEAAYPEMLDALRRILGSFSEGRMPLLYNLWDITVRQRRFTFSSPSVDRYVFEQVTPFVDNEVVEWALRMPLRHLFGQCAYKRMILTTFPRIADVPWTRTGRPVPASFAADMARQGMLFAWKRLQRRRPKPRSSGRRAGSESGLWEPALRARAEAYLGSDAFLSDVFDRDGIRGMLERHFDRGEDFSTPLAMLLTVAESTRLFVERRRTSPPDDVRPRLSGDT